MIENFSALNHYQSKTLVFSTPISASEKFSEKQNEWVVDFYPKGLLFDKGLLIIWQASLLIKIICALQLFNTNKLTRNLSLFSTGNIGMSRVRNEANTTLRELQE
jgi:hypothetical protein